jgi:phage antirepressor protein
MNNVEIFKNNEFGEIRTIIKENGESMFCLSDICRILELENPSKTSTRLNSSGITKSYIGINTGLAIQNVEMLFIDEANLYKCIFRSNKPNAEKFTEWVTSEVLPSIRKHGMYATDNTIENILNNPDFGIQLLTKLKEERERNKELEKKVVEMKPKEDFYDAVTQSNETCDFAQAAKILNFKDIGRNKLFEILRQNNQSYQRYVDSGWFKVVEVSSVDRYGDLRLFYKTVIYQKGLDKISKILLDLGYENK